MRSSPARFAPLLGALLALPALAQDAPPASQPATPAPAGPTLRVSVDVSSTVDDQVEPVNGWQYLLFEKLATFGLRVDSLRPVGQERYDAWIAKKTQRWEQQQPEAPPATLAISGTSGAKYDNAEFFGQGQAHNFRGQAQVEIKDAAGASVARIAFEHSWGRLPQKYTQSQAQNEYHQMVHTAMTLAVLSRPEIQAGVPEAKRSELQTFITTEKDKLLKVLRNNNMAESQMAALLEGLGAPAQAPPKKGEGAPRR